MPEYVRTATGVRVYDGLNDALHDSTSCFLVDVRFENDFIRAVYVEGIICRRCVRREGTILQYKCRIIRSLWCVFFF